MRTYPPQVMGEACLLLGRAQKALGDRALAELNLLEAAHHFEAAGAEQRADQARDYLADEP